MMCVRVRVCVCACVCDPSYVLQNGRSALHLAAQSGHSDVVEYLLARGADPNLQDKVIEEGAFLSPSCVHAAGV